MKRVYVIQDDEGHWYVIPFDRKNEFIHDQMSMDIDSGEFDDKWGGFRTGGNLNLIPLYAEI